MDAQTHWENIYGKKTADAVSWYRPHLETSLELIGRAAPLHAASIIDIGGGESTLVDDLLARGYLDISVLDISQTAVDANKKRLGPASEHIHWLVADITKAKLESCAYDVWHDRAVFHFLTALEERIAYVRQINLLPTACPIVSMALLFTSSGCLAFIMGLVFDCACRLSARGSTHHLDTSDHDRLDDGRS